MRNWNDNLSMKRDVNGKIINIGQQNFTDKTVSVKEGNGNIIKCPMLMDEKGNIYFIYNQMGVYISEYMGNFQI